LKGKPFTVDHTAESVDRGIKEGYGGDPLGMVEAYFAAEASMIRAGGFDVLAHPDLVRKNNSGPQHRRNRLFSEDSAFYREKISSIATLMAGRGIPSEVNTGGLNRGKMGDCYPSPEFLELFREKGVPMLINSDAHRAEDLDGHYDKARMAMLSAGYTETLIFEGRRNGEAVWRKEKL